MGTGHTSIDIAVNF